MHTVDTFANRGFNFCMRKYAQCGPRPSAAQNFNFLSQHFGIKSFYTNIYTCTGTYILIN